MQSFANGQKKMQTKKAAAKRGSLSPHDILRLLLTKIGF